jgi:tyrosyl-tRNA synthetase
MSIPDELMWNYYELLTDRTQKDILELKAQVVSGTLHPMDAKMNLSHQIVKTFHGSLSADSAKNNFQRVFRDRKAPVELPEIRLKRRPDGFLQSEGHEHPPQVISSSPKWSQLIKSLAQAESISEAARIIEQGGLEVDGIVFNDPRAKLDTTFDGMYDVRFGKKKFFRLIVE